MWLSRCSQCKEWNEILSTPQDTQYYSKSNRRECEKAQSKNRDSKSSQLYLEQQNHRSLIQNHFQSCLYAHQSYFNSEWKRKKKIFENHTEQWFSHFCFLAVKAIVFSLNNLYPVMWTSEPKPTAALYTLFYSRANYGLEPQTGETLHWNDHR